MNIIDVFIYRYSDLFWGGMSILSFFFAVFSFIYPFIANFNDKKQNNNNNKRNNNRNNNKISEKQKNKNKDFIRSKISFKYIVSVLLVLLVINVGVYVIFSIRKSSLVEMPELTNLKYSDASLTLNHYKINCIINNNEEIYNPDKYIVINQSIPQGMIIKKNSTVLLTILEIKERETEASNNSNSHQNINNNSYAYGSNIYAAPNANIEIYGGQIISNNFGDTTNNYNGFDTTVYVPDVVGYELEDAVNILVENNLSYFLVIDRSNIINDKIEGNENCSYLVTSQSYAPEEVVMPYTIVVLQIIPFIE